MRSMTVLYDSECDFCGRCRAWAESQPQYIQLRFIARDSQRARRDYPQLTTTGDELIAIGDDGSVYRNAKAWLMCMYALRRYRPLALRLSRPGMQGFARRVFNLISHHRRRVPSWLLPARNDRLAAHLRNVQEPLACASSHPTTRALRDVKIRSRARHTA